MSEGRVTTVWEYIDGTHVGLRFSSGDVEDWRGCKLTAREIDMNEKKRLELIRKTNTLTAIKLAYLKEFHECVEEIFDGEPKES